MTFPQITSIEESITDELSELLGRKVNLEKHTDLRDEGLDSIVTIKLIINLEVKFDIQIEDDDLLIENFSTLNKISNLLSQKYGVLT
ncbi:acyl carrier protein [Paenibacillus sp. OK003]|uniref:acyl carrier protein n=1 Tax=Paenibacillus sp. OK003 TaxID=1884380 RepID=UPI0008ABC4F0|nr:acyl carrier protein [Paenibacillus sp. OK003]SEL55450.1 Phosphopantetheine attachment site [Paenibacillus sp. OK003]